MFNGLLYFENLNQKSIGATIQAITRKLRWIGYTLFIGVDSDYEYLGSYYWLAGRIEEGCLKVQIGDQF